MKVRLTAKEVETVAKALRLAADAEWAHADCCKGFDGRVTKGFGSMYRSSMAAYDRYRRLANKLEAMASDPLDTSYKMS